MRLVGITRFGLGLVAVGLVGCGGMAGELVDAGRLDGGAAPPPHDAGAPGGDAGSTAFDAGANEAADAGGGSATDAGGTGVDSGVPPRDAGTPPPDAGQTPADAGTPSRDAGGPPPDAGTAPHIDSFTGAPDNVKAGSPATLQWVLGGDAPTSLTVNATNVLNNAGNSHHVSPTAPSTTYQLTATNAAGTSTATVTIRVEAADSPYIDARKIPAAQTGFSTAGVEPTAMPIDPDGGGVGAFRLGCTFSHMNFDDPLLFAKQPGAAVLNTYFGNVGVNAWSTDHSVQKSGNSTCAGGTLNRTGYWLLALIDTTDGTPIAPSGMLVYYKTGYGGVRPADVKAVPAGLHMVAGDLTNTTEEGDTAGRFSCVGGDLGVGWQKALPTNCYQNNQMIFEVAFPQCWDGVNLDSIDHKRHMADATGSGCPPTHPVALPEITYEIYYDLANVDLSRMKKWRLSSDHYDPSVPAGYSAHADYLYGWDAATMAKFIANCDNAGADCHANLLGDGTWLY